MKNETIVLANTLDTELKDLPKRVPKDAARYHFFLYKHTHEGDYLESISMRKFLNMKIYWLVCGYGGTTTCVTFLRNFDSMRKMCQHDHKFQSHLVVKLQTCEGEL